MATSMLQLPNYTPTTWDPSGGFNANSLMFNNNSALAAPAAAPALAPFNPAATTPSTAPSSYFPAAPGAPATGIMSAFNPSATPGATPPSSGLGMNTGTMGLVLGGIQTIGSLWNAWEQNKLAKQQFAFTKDFTNTNLRNSIQSYNTNLAAQTDLRASYEGWSQNKEDRYIKNNQATRH